MQDSVPRGPELDNPVLHPLIMHNSTAVASHCVQVGQVGQRGGGPSIQRLAVPSPALSLVSILGQYIKTHTANGYAHKHTIVDVELTEGVNN